MKSFPHSPETDASASVTTRLYFPPQWFPPSLLQTQPPFDEKEKATILYADRVTRAATAIRAAELEELHKFYDEGQIVELTLAICMAKFTNRFNDTLENIPDLGV